MNKKRFNFICEYIIIIMVFILSFYILEAINANQHLEMMKEYVNESISIPNNYYDLSNIKFKKVYLSSKYELKDKCIDGCNLSVSKNKRLIYYMIEKKDNSYYFKIVVNSRIIISNQFFGDNLDNAYIDQYLENIILFNTIDENVTVYDYVNVIGKNYSIDEFKSIGANTLEFTDDGILYNYARCRENSEEEDHLLRVKRKIFASDEEIISDDNSNFSWCA